MRKVRTSKHRYVYFTDKKDVKFLNYDILEYPKGDNKKYRIGDRMKTKVLNKKDNTEFYI